MLRMGRTQRVDQPENQRAFAPQDAPASNPLQQTAPPPTSTAQPGRPEAERPPTVSRAVSETEAIARDIKEGILSGFVGGGTVLNGEANFKGMLRIDGHLTGRINSEKGTLIVSAGGQVDANIEVATAKINGIVRGDIIATERIEMGRTAQLYGNIQTPALVIDQGALFEGTCRMVQARAEVKKEAAHKATPAPRAAEPDAKHLHVAKSSMPAPVSPPATAELSEVNG